MTEFVSLHNSTVYSPLDSLCRPKDLMQAAKDLGMKAIAITEHGSLASAWDAWKSSKEVGIKLIIGSELYFVNDAQNREGEKLRHIMLIAKNAVGYRNLLTLLKKGFDNNPFDGKRVYSIIDWKLLEEHKDGLICLTACGNGIVPALLASKPEEVVSTLLKLKEMFGDDLGLEVQPNNMDRGKNQFNEKIDQRFINRKLINLGKEHGIKVVAACNTHYIKKEDAPVHDVLLAIGSHQPVYSNFRLKYPVPDFYLKSGEEVKSFFSRNYGDELAAELCSNSIYFSDKCEVPEWIDPKFTNPSGKELPEFPVKDSADYNQYLLWLNSQNKDIQLLDEDASYLRFKCFSSFEENFKKDIDPSLHELYFNRIEKELSVLDYKKFSSYMLIVADYVEWCRRNSIGTGSGRGSCAGCMVAYLLKIHIADPIRYGLIFERFLNKEKTDFPDVDQDIAAYGRQKVIGYIIDKYGKDNVAAISNFNRMTAKVYVKDISRSLELGGSKERATEVGEAIAGTISFDNIKQLNMDSLLKIPMFSEYCKQYPQMLDNKSILGQFRNFSMHAAAIVIGKRPLVGLVPLRRDKDGFQIMEYDKYQAEANGMVKMDILGISSIDLMEETLALINKNHGLNLNINSINVNDYDEKTYDLISKGDTFGVFQFGTSAGTIDLCKKIKPRSLEDLAIITTLARPGARDIRSEFIATREGKKKVILLHECLRDAYKNTFGYGLYDETILQLGRDVAGWDLNSSDRLRKMMKEKGKNPEKDKKLGEEFVQGAISKGINPIIAQRIWDEELKKFASYTFNKSHAITYSMISFQTAWLKAHYPIEFLTANLMAEVHSNAPAAKSNIEKYKKEIRAHKIKILPPNINTSQMTYVLDGKNLITGLDALKSVGDEAIKDLIEKRPFKSFSDLMTRVNSSKVRANNIQALAVCGALDSFKLTRKQIFYYCSDYRKKLQIWLKKHDPLTEEFVYPFPNEPEFTLAEKYAFEMHYMNESFACAPGKAYNNFFSDNHDTIATIKKSENKTYLSSVKVILRDFFEFKIKKETSKMYGKAMAKLLIEDKFGNQCSATVFPDAWDQIQEHLKFAKKIKFEPGIGINFAGNVNLYEDELGIIFNKIYSIAPVPQRPADLKPKKINLKTGKKTEKVDIEDASKSKPLNDSDDLFEQLEDGLYEDGLLDLDGDF